MTQEVSVKETITLLRRLQESDMEIEQLNDKIASIPRKKEVLSRGLQQYMQVVEEEENRLADSRKERRQLEHNLEDHNLKDARYTDQLMQVKTNKEYRALLTEIEQLKGKIREIEDKILDLMEEAEELEKSIGRRKKKLEKKKQEVETESHRLEKEEAALNHQLEKKEAFKRELENKLPLELIEQYNRIKSVRHGIALAEAKDGFCQVCHVRLRPQVYYDLRANKSILLCDNCHRFLFLREDEVVDPTKLM